MTDSRAFPDRIVLAVDVCLLCVRDGRLAAVMRRRDDADVVGGDWALPGAVMSAAETPRKTARRVVADRLGFAHHVHLEQLATFGALDRDPRGRAVSVVYLGLSPAEPLERGVEDQPATALVPIGDPEHSLAFDHTDILRAATERLRGKIDYTPVGLSLLPDTFTLREAQGVWEAVHGRSFSKPPFRRKLLDRDILEDTGEMERGAAFRPAKLYRAKPQAIGG